MILEKGIYRWMASSQPKLGSLVLVESPAKVKTIETYLGSEFRVLATGGHILDLPASRLAVDVNRDFAIEKEPIPRKTKQVALLKKTIAGYKKIYIATDPDREGEAIAYDLLSLGSKTKEWIRVGFREITPEAVLAKIKSPDQFEDSIRVAQETRRILDRLFGYLVSPILWKRIQPGLSAGRVQSVLLRWICEREEDIRNFQPEEYIDIAVVHIDPRLETAFPFRWVKKKQKPDPILWKKLSSLAKVESLEEKLSDKKKFQFSVEDKFTISSVEDKKSSQLPPPAFKTSSLQEEAYKSLGFSPKKTMSLAQKLYEGVDLPGGKRLGLITYPRTDSVRISPKYRKLGEEIILNLYGSSYIGKSFAPSKSKNKIQDAHEAIRPTDPHCNPDQLTIILSPDERKLYDLIYRRFMASLTAARLGIKKKILLEGWGEDWVREEFLETFPGFKIWYPSSKEKEKILSIPKEKKISIHQVELEAKSTEPPGRYNHASLVKKMESTGVGRPSTYSPSIEVLTKRNYIEWIQKKAHPTNLGEEVYSLLKLSFSEWIEDNFTKKMEESLDRIELGELGKLDVLKPFYQDLSKTIGNVGKVIREIKKCPSCMTGVVQKKRDKKGKILLYCSRFPECDYGEYA